MGLDPVSWALIGGAVLGAGGSAIASSAGKSKAPTSSASASPQVDPTKAASKEDATAQRVGRAALISTSPQGVLDTSGTGRRRLLGN